MLHWIVFSTLAFAPDSTHYAVRVAWEQHSSCSRSWAHDKIAASLSLDLAHSGDATACRGSHHDGIGGGWESGARNNAPERRVYQEQQGYRGAWRRDGERLLIELAVDDRVCPRIAPYKPLGRPWSLECVPARTLDGFEAAPEDMLACTERSKDYVDGKLGLEVHALTEQPVILLGRGAGAVVEWTDSGMLGQLAIRLGIAAEPISRDGWRLPPPPSRTVAVKTK